MVCSSRLCTLIKAHYFTQAYQNLLDSIVPYRIPRWIFSVVALLMYGVRVFFLQGWYIVTYALAIYLLNLFIAFITPKFDPANEEDDEMGMYKKSRQKQK